MRGMNTHFVLQLSPYLSSADARRLDTHPDQTQQWTLTPPCIFLCARLSSFQPVSQVLPYASHTIPLLRIIGETRETV
jgi:hypothetical protein